MYTISNSNKKTERKLEEYILQRQDIPAKLDRLKEDPRKECGAHPLKGPLKGKWAAWLGSNIRIVYVIDEFNKKIIIVAIGTHKGY